LKKWLHSSQVAPKSLIKNGAATNFTTTPSAASFTYVTVLYGN